MASGKVELLAALLKLQQTPLRQGLQKAHMLLVVRPWALHLISQVRVFTLRSFWFITVIVVVPSVSISSLFEEVFFLVLDHDSGTL